MSSSSLSSPSPPFSPPKSASSSNKTKNKATKRLISSDEDPFASALNAVDKIKPSKTKRQRDASFIAEVERSLASSVRAAAVAANSKASSSASASSIPPANGLSISEVGIVKAKTLSHKVYAGRRKAQPSNGVVPKLFDICMRICINNIDAIEETGDIPFHVLRPVLERCTHTQLARLEAKNRYLEEDTDCLWEKHCHDVFSNEDISRDSHNETWKQYFFRLTHEREERLKRLSARIGANNREIMQPQRKAILADPIAPRDARRRQIKNGTMVHSSAVPNAADLSRSRRQIFEKGSTDALRKVHPAVRNTLKISAAGGGSATGAATKSYAAGSSSSSCSSANEAGVRIASSSASAAAASTSTSVSRRPAFGGTTSSAGGGGAKKGALMAKALKMMKARRN